MYSEDLKEIFGPRKWRSRTEEIMQLQAARDAEREKQQNPDGAPETPADTPADGEPIKSDEPVPPSTPTPPPFKGPKE